MREESSEPRSIPIVWSSTAITVEVRREDDRVHVVAPIGMQAIRVIEAAKPNLSEAEYESMWEAFGL